MPDTVCIFLGPYRNLTTLTATALHFHPNIQVLEHGLRAMGEDAFKFISADGSEDFQAFVERALELSQGTTPDGGGSIMGAFTFGSEMATGGAKITRSGKRLKEDIRCLAWKESMRVTYSLLKRGIMWPGLFQNNAKLRFLMPIRDPMDCAISNSRQSKWLLFDGINDNDARMVLRGVLAQHAWFFGLQQRFPDRFFHFYEFDMGDAVLESLAGFLAIPYDGEWAESAKRMWDIRRSYQVSSDFIDYYFSMVDLHFSAWPAERDRMRQFINLANVGQMPARDWMKKETE